MKFNRDIPQFAHACVYVVAYAKERAVIYKVHDGELVQVTYVNEVSPEYSDREGFFQRSGGGEYFGSGAPYEEPKQEIIASTVRATADELWALMKEESPAAVYVFEPEHLKRQLERKLTNPAHVPVHTVRFGNFVGARPNELVNFIAEYHEPTIDPADPNSVSDEEENADEKRKILNVGRER